MKYAIALIAAIAATSTAAQDCAPTGDVYEALEQRFEEYRIFAGMTQDGVLEVWGNPKTESWTMIATAPNGVSCVIGEGVGFHAIDPGEPA